LRSVPPGFDRSITQATNFQNAVVRRDFVAMDPLQHRLSTDFALDRRRYVYKSGEDDPRGEDGCSITEATQALGCAASMELAVQAKREISELWADITKAPYTDLFNSSLTSIHLWKAVQIMRAVDEELQKLRGSSPPRADLVGVHLNRALLHLVFRDPRIRAFRADRARESVLVSDARAAIKELFPKAAAYVEKIHSNEYPASIAKNIEKCNAMAAALTAPPEPVSSSPIPPDEKQEQGKLF
jgi:hypothetical protein